MVLLAVFFKMLLFFVGRADEQEMLHYVCNSGLDEVLTRFSEVNESLSC